MDPSHHMYAKSSRLNQSFQNPFKLAPEGGEGDPTDGTTGSHPHKEFNKKTAVSDPLHFPPGYIVTKKFIRKRLFPEPFSNSYSGGCV